MADNAKVSRFERFRKGIVRFFKEIRTELKKVVWLSWKQLKNNTITVLLACLLVGAVIWIADLLLSQLVGLLFV
ncbi:MAG: preprotein translocase subunit SecE [Acetivibrionales bacterium]